MTPSNENNSKNGRQGKKMAAILSLLLVATLLSGGEGKERELRRRKLPVNNVGNSIGAWDMAVKSPSEPVDNAAITAWEDATKDHPSDSLLEPVRYDEFIPEPAIEKPPPVKKSSQPAPDTIKKFKKNHSLKEADDLPMQELSASNTFNAAGKQFSLENLTPMNVFTAGATYMSDGIEMESLPPPSVLMKKEGDDMMIVTKFATNIDRLRSIDIVHGDGSVTYMEEVAEGIVATVLPESRNRDALKKFVMAHRDIGEDAEVKYEDEMAEVKPESGDTETDAGGFWRKLFDLRDGDHTPEGDARKLQNDCNSFKVIEVAIAYESSYCSDMGGASNSNAAVQQIVAKASTLYQNNFCTKIEISHLEGFCIQNSDPYREGVILNNSGCGGNGLLDAFANFWFRNRGSINRDSAHLFSGTGLECTGNSCVIGCATRASLCSSTTSYGVNFITFSSDGQMQANLFAHELGHNAGSGHDDTTNRFEYIMEPSINGGSNGFSQRSRNTITEYLNTKNCIDTDSSGPTGPEPTAPTGPEPTAPTGPEPTAPTGPEPTAPTGPEPTAPTGPEPTAPTAPSGPAPTDAPCGCDACTRSVLISNAQGYRCVDRINWVITTQGMSQLDACSLVSERFPSICGPECDPSRCDGGSGSSGGRGKVQNAYDSSCMMVDTSNSNVFASSDCDDDSDQEWIYDPDTQRIMTAFNPNYCLAWDLYNNNLVVFPCHNGSNMKWTVDSKSRIKSVHYPLACVDLSIFSRNYYLNYCGDATDQQFVLPTGFS